MYKINPSSYSSVFVLPAEIADKHLRLAGKAQLKVLLWLFRNPTVEFSLDAVSRDTGIPRDEIDDAMLYWINAGLITKSGEEAPQPSPVQTAEASATQLLRKEQEAEKIAAVQVNEPPVQTVVSVQKEKPVIVKPSIKDIAMRISESEDIRSMFAEAQESFGRTLGYDAQSSLLILHDHYALPPEVIIMLCSYAKTIGKQGSLAYIMKMGEAWAECGITDFDSASRKIARMENSQNIWDNFRRLTGIENPKPTMKQADYLEIWINDFGYDADMIYHAYEKAVEIKGKLNWGYMNGILRSWNESNFRTIDQVEKAGAEYAKGTAQKQPVREKAVAAGYEAPPSYDVESAVKKSRMVDPNKTKKGL